MLGGRHLARRQAPRRGNGLGLNLLNWFASWLFLSHLDIDGDVQPEEPALAAVRFADVIHGVGAQADLSLGPRGRFQLEVECALLFRYGFLSSGAQEQLFHGLPSLRRINPEAQRIGLVIPVSLLLGVGPQNHVDADSLAGTDPMPLSV